MPSHLNVEIKARCLDIETIRRILLECGATFLGLDHQIDTYFIVPNGRLKLREGGIENYLIHYRRADVSSLKESAVILHEITSSESPKEILRAALGILVVVDKARQIYRIANVKFHIDEVVGLGKFVEIEARGEESERDQLSEQCSQYMRILKLQEHDLIAVSYSDMLLAKL